ncbi:MAG: AbrB/MazE/SpoVT family DNA-binding domain-containing protein [Oscillospiraceae bacterium]|nr:AbrB/MazE/SpoVT family DNA-binding domain-containing protein [Oscillospiraceae bacterium]
MEVAKVTSKGQITIPISIRRKLEINEGDKVLFVYKPEGVLMVNPNIYQAGAADFAETAKAESLEKSVTPAKEKSAARAPQKTVIQPEKEIDDKDIYVEDEIIYAESKEEVMPEPKVSPARTTATESGKQVGGLDLSTLLDDIRSIGSKI